MKLLVTWFGKLLIVALRILGKGGAALPGLLVEKIYPKYVSKIAGQLRGGSILVTGTNGKTTTTKFLRTILHDAGQKVISNRAGSNLSRGVASAFLEHSNWLGKIDADFGLFEVDEAFMGDVAAKLRPQIVVVLNLLRDQLDRYGELDRTAELIAAGLGHAQSAVLNADDPMVASLAASVGSGSVVFFGATPKLRAQLPHDDELLRQHGRPTSRAAKPASKLNVLLSKIAETGQSQSIEVEYAGQSYRTTLKLKGVYNAYNALAAVSAATLTTAVDFSQAVKSLGRTQPAFGRTELINMGDKKLQLLLVKNPAGFNQIIKTFLTKPGCQLLIAINDNFADGRDVSWLWDVDFEQLAGKNHQIIATGSRGFDLQVRLKYADILSTTETDPQAALKHFVDGLPAGSTGYIVPTYTAMLGLRQMLAKQAEVAKVWH